MQNSSQADRSSISGNRPAATNSQKKEENKTNTIEAPNISLPKGGGAIKGIDEKFSVNAINGTANFSIQLPFSSARGFTPVINLNYNSGNGNGTFGLGWSLSLPSIKRKTQKELPQYLDKIDSDTYVVSDAEDLVPEYKKDNTGNFLVDENEDFIINEFDLVLDGITYQVRRYRPRIEGGFSRIERWTEKSTGIIHWRSISRSNVTALYGKTPSTRVADPTDNKKIFEWFLEFTYDDKGNCALYEYKTEDGAGLNSSLLHNKNRFIGNAPFANTYLKRVRYGIHSPYTNQGEIFPTPADFFFETVLDYGEHDTVIPFNETNAWTFRTDAFSEYRSGFEIRTCRLCNRILLYHHFEALPGGSALIKSLQLIYDDNGEDGFSFLSEIVNTGYTKHDSGNYTEKSTPPFSFTYQKHSWNTNVNTIASGEVENLPAGIDDTAYLFVDLYNEGLSGILTEQNEAWYYKNNLGGGDFAPAKLILSKPSYNGLGNKLQLLELDANGSKQIVNWASDPKGFFEISDEEEWQPFTLFESVPNIDLRDANTRLVDLNGDGMADVLITEDEVLTWYPSNGKKGYENPKRMVKSQDEEMGPSLVFADQNQTVLLADMSGDGLQDLVRIRNGNVSYWPNRGYGKFGAKVTMDHSPLFDFDDQFNASRIRLADIDGSGTTDVIYLGQNECSIWLNQQGNSFLLTPKKIEAFPDVNDFTNIHVADLLGTGLSCIVWNSPLPKDSERSLKYIDLMSSKKPHILIGYKNNMGKEVEMEYTASTQYYIDDKLAGAPWVTKLHFPVHCVSKTVTYDRILKTRFASEYTYHHGYYDHFEKEFRGFGRADQKDSEDVTHFILQGGTNAVIEEDLHQAPVLTKTWFHTGAFLDREKILNQFAHEYFQNSIVLENLLPEPQLPSSLSIQEFREALRSCKGTMLRKEVYALDESVDQDSPYVVEQHNSLIKILQPTGKNKFAIYFTHESESITYHYERNPADPRIAHSFIFDVDPFGNVLQSANVVYPRKINPLPSPEQVQMHISFFENSFTNAIEQDFDYRTPSPHFTKTYEVSGITAPLGYFELENIETDCNNAAGIDYEVTPNGSLQKRLIEFVRTQYRGDDTTTILPFGTIESKVLMDQSFKAAFNNAILSNVFSSKISLPSLTAILTDPVKGGHIFSDGYFWLKTSTSNYEAAHFFLPTQYTDAFGNKTQVAYDTNFLFIEQLMDALNNTSRIEKFNYRLLSPFQMKDSNDNLAAVRFDELGVVTEIFTIGKKGIDAGDEFDDTKVETEGAIDFPGSVMEYSFSEWYNQTQEVGFDINNYKPRPNFIKTRTRETHHHADPLHQTNWQESYAYCDGSGNIVMKKIQAEPGEALQVNDDGTVTLIPDTTPDLRWVGNGRTIINNKGKAVKQYEPYFSVAPTFDDEKEMVQLGVTPIFQYDPIGRLVRADAPNKTFTKVEFTPWLQKVFDSNDTVMDSTWYIELGSPNPVGPEPLDAEERAAWLAAKHNNTPVIHHFDNLGRTFLISNTDGINAIETKTVLDIEGNPLQIIDPLGRTAMEYAYGMLGNKLKELSIDAGSRWNITDAAGKPLLSWNERGHSFSNEYDALQRPTILQVEESGITTMFLRTEYGEVLSTAVAKDGNLLGKVYKHYDQSGITTNLQYDFKGNILNNTAQLVQDYQNGIDWSNIPAVLMESEVFEGSGEFDALSRPIRIVAPHVPLSPQSEIIPSYNEAAMLEKVDVRIRGAISPTSFVTNINYNARGQREAIYYGNGTKTSYTYEKETFRLLRLLTTRNNGATILQDLNYTFDPVGNITQIKDDAQPDVFFDSELVKSLNKYEYDAFYRLLKATGRKHAGQTDINHNGTGNPPNFRNHTFVDSPSINPNDAQAFRNYTEQYQYDNAGNMLLQQHTAKSSNWSRTFEYDGGSNLNNRLTSTTLGPDTFNYTYDVHGNMHGLETIFNEVWNFLDQFSQADLGGGGTAYYVYNAQGQRVRKVIERLDGTKKERLYLGALEIYRERDNTDTVVLERETLHVMDDKKRIAMIDTPVIKPLSNNETELIRYQYDNHLGSASLELDDIAQVISYEEYFPFGTTSYSTIDATREVAAKRYRYTGKERDEESGLNYHGARYCAPWICRWTKSDPVGIKGGLNFFSYVGNNPIIMNDPTGNDGETCGVWDEEAQACYAEPCALMSTEGETPAVPPPAPLPPRVRYVPRRPPAPPPPPPPPPEPDPVAGYEFVGNDAGMIEDSGTGGAPPSYNDGGAEGADAGTSSPGADTSDSGSGLTTGVGALQLGGGAFEMYGGATIAFATCPETFGIGCVAGLIMILHGADTASSGVETLATDRVSLTYTHRGFAAGATGLGADEDTARWVGTGGDLVVGLGASWTGAATTTLRVAPGTALVHLTGDDAALAINASSTLRGSSGIYAGPASLADASPVVVTLRTGIAPGTYSAIPIPPGAVGSFVRPIPVGPITAWQSLTGQVHTGAGAINLTTGAFTASGTTLNHALFYVVDGTLVTVLPATVAPLAESVEPNRSE